MHKHFFRNFCALCTTRVHIIFLFPLDWYYILVTFALKKSNPVACKIDRGRNPPPWLVSQKHAIIERVNYTFFSWNYNNGFITSFLAATKWPAQRPLMSCPVLFCLSNLVTECLYLLLSLSIKLGYLWNFKPKLLCYKPLIPTCLFPIWGDYPMS